MDENSDLAFFRSVGETLQFLFKHKCVIDSVSLTWEIRMEM